MSSETGSKIDTFVDPAKVAADVAVNESDLQGEISRQAGLVYFYTSRAALADRQAARYKLALELKEAEISAQVRANAGDKKLTVDAIKEQVRLHKDVTALEVALLKSEEVAATLKGVVTAIRDKSANLITLAHMRRDDLRAKIAIMEDSAPPPANTDLGEKAASLKARMGSNH